MNLQYFNNQDFYLSVKKFFEDLNIPIHYMTEQPASAKEIISNNYKPKNHAHQLIDDVYFLGMVDDRAFNNQPSTIESDRLKEKDYDGLLIFGVTLDREGGKLPTRGQMVEITRAFNREFHYTPVVIVFKYDRYICFSNCERIPYKQKWREGEKTGKVSLLKDIDIANTHTGHLKILQNLAIPTSGKKAVTTFEGLYNYWQEVFSVALLNKQFYQELSCWYFWALREVTFPSQNDIEEDIRNPINVIRLITRIIFVWFVKEKGLIPEAIFNRQEVENLLKDFSLESSSYYKAILQNLFFATLNTKMGERKFRDERRFQGKNDSYMLHNYFRYRSFFKNPDDILELLKGTPFLNGGLFECLDKETDRITRIDGFSDRSDNELHVFNDLFFSGEQTIDLNEDFGTKGKKYKVRGIIHVLNSYKFTIAENTPVEEEIALDPELLGRVFENLLASYNPETRTTARKQTGSFYTPREIVNYMVDESLIAYLESILVSDYEKQLEYRSKKPRAKRKQINKNLRHLFEYTEELPYFDDHETDILINAIDNVKILDPACGSGAFPMGILHRLVFILNRLDPENKQWKNKQITKAEQIEIASARKAAIQDIEQAFNKSKLDYPRKLYLIQNCIFGVDIQPVAAQIAKLRFFISLFVDQNIDEKEVNRGMIPLPNLETKLVSANTLIGFRGKSPLKGQEIIDLERELKHVRKQYFDARNRKKKKKSWKS